MIGAQNRQPPEGDVAREAMERVFQGVHFAVVVEVVRIDVGDNGDAG